MSNTLGTINIGVNVNTSQATASINDLKKQLKTAGDGMQKVGSNMTKFLTVPLVGLGTAAIATFANFEQGMSKVQAITGATGSEMEQLTAEAKRLGSTTKYSASEAAEAMAFLGMAGWKTTDIMSGLEGMLNLASAGGTDLALTADIVSDGLTAMGMSAKDSTRFADIMAATVTSANTDIAMMGETMKYAGPVAGTLGVTMEDLSIAIGLMGNAGIKASQAGTGLRTGLTELGISGSKASKIMGDYGVEIVRTNDGSLDFLATMKNMRTGLKDLTKEERLAALEASFGKNAMSAWAAVVNASEDDFNKLSGAIGDSAGKSKEMADIMQDNVAGNVDALKSAFEGLLITIGEHLVPVFTQLMEKLNGAIEWFGGLDEGTQKTIVNLGIFTATLGPIISIAGKLTSAMSLLAPVFTGVGASATAAAGVGAAGAAGAGAAGLGATFTALLPILAPVAAGVAIVGGALWGFNEYAKETAVLTFDETLKSVEGLSDSTATMVSSVKTDFDTFKTMIQDTVIETEEQAISLFTKVEENARVHSEKILGMVDENYRDKEQMYQFYAENSTGEEQAYYQNQLKLLADQKSAEVGEVQGLYDELATIQGIAAGKKRGLTEAEETKILDLKKQLSTLEVENAVQTSEELKALDENRFAFEQSMNAESASAAIASAEELRQSRIAIAEQMFQDASVHVTRNNALSAEEKDAQISILEAKKNESISIANAEKIAVVQEMGNQWGDMYKVVDTKSGEIHGKWTQGWKGMFSSQKTETNKMLQDLGYSMNDINNLTANGYDGMNGTVKDAMANMKSVTSESLQAQGRSQQEAQMIVESYQKTLGKYSTTSVKDLDVYQKKYTNAMTSTSKDAKSAEKSVSSLSKELKNVPKDVKSKITVTKTTTEKTINLGTEQKGKSRIDSTNFVNSEILRDSVASVYSASGFNPGGLYNDASNATSALDNMKSTFEKLIKELIKKPDQSASGLNINIDKFENNREMDIKKLAEELEFYRKKASRGGY